MKTEKFKSIVVGKESKVSKENVPYGVVTIMDGATPLNLVTRDSDLFNGLVLYKPCEVVLDIKLGKYPKAEIVEICTVKE